MTITTHQYLDKYPISRDSKKLIIGTIHPHDHENFEIPFFYGSRSSIWKILSDAFPEDIKLPITLPGVLAFLQKHKISVSDTIHKCKRINPTALDKDLLPIELNKAIFDQIKNSEISEILFTSGFQKNNAFKLFYTDILGKVITPDIRANREIILENNIFGRPIKLKVLYSPSGSSNVGLSKSKQYLENQSKYVGLNRPVYRFKVDYYRQMFE
jgi:G:T/U-mismatch repair DNA glycosylase